MVTGAAGAVGSLVGQIGKIKGCRVVGKHSILQSTSRFLERLTGQCILQNPDSSRPILLLEFRRLVYMTLYIIIGQALLLVPLTATKST